MGSTPPGVERRVSIEVVFVRAEALFSHSNEEDGEPSERNLGEAKGGRGGRNEAVSGRLLVIVVCGMLLLLFSSLLSCKANVKVLTSWQVRWT